MIYSLQAKKNRQTFFRTSNQFIPEIMNAVNDMGSCMFCTKSHRRGTHCFTEVNSIFSIKKLKVREQEYLIPLIEEFKKEMPIVYKHRSPRNYFFSNLNKNWEQVFNLLN